MQDSHAAIKRESSFYTPSAVLALQIAEAREKHSADSQAHINTLLTKTLLGALKSLRNGTSDDRTLIMEILTTFVILQPSSAPELMPDFPSTILRDIRVGLSLGASKGAGPVVAEGLLFVASALHSNGAWLKEYWTQAGDVMSECISAGHAMPALKAIDVTLSGLKA